MKNWKTTLCGAITALGVFLTNQSDPKLNIAGQVLVGLGTFLIGLVAKDSNVTGGSIPQTGEASNRTR